MIATQYKWKASSLHGCCHRPRNPARHGKDAIKVFESGIGDAACLLNGDFNIALVIKSVSQLFEFLMKVRIPYGAGTHVHTAPICAKVNRNTDNINLHILLLKNLAAKMHTSSIRRAFFAVHQLSNLVVRLRPPFLERYRALSAACNIASPVRPCSGNAATPAENVVENFMSSYAMADSEKSYRHASTRS